MTWKKRWVFKAVTWKILSLLWGAGVVHWLTGETRIGAEYLLYFGLPSMVAFVLHEKAYHMGKVWARRREDEKCTPSQSERSTSAMGIEVATEIPKVQNRRRLSHDFQEEARADPERGGRGRGSL